MRVVSDDAMFCFVSSFSNVKIPETIEEEDLFDEKKQQPRQQMHMHLQRGHLHQPWMMHQRPSPYMQYPAPGSYGAQMMPMQNFFQHGNNFIPNQQQIQMQQYQMNQQFAMAHAALQQQQQQQQMNQFSQMQQHQQEFSQNSLAHTNGNTTEISYQSAQNEANISKTVHFGAFVPPTSSSSNTSNQPTQNIKPTVLDYDIDEPDFDQSDDFPFSSNRITSYSMDSFNFVDSSNDEESPLVQEPKNNTSMPRSKSASIHMPDDWDLFDFCM